MDAAAAPDGLIAGPRRVTRGRITVNRMPARDGLDRDLPVQAGRDRVSAMSVHLRSTPPRSVSVMARSEATWPSRGRYRWMATPLRGSPWRILFRGVGTA